MADKAIGDLPQAEVISNNDLFLLEQGGAAKKLLGSQLTAFINRNVIGVTVNIVPSTQTGGGTYNAETGMLTLNIPEGNGIVGLSKTGSSGNADTYRLTYEDGTHSSFTVYNGSNIQSIAKTATVGLVDSYTITLTDGSITTFQVRNGADGQGLVNSVMGISPDANLDIPEAAVLDKIRRVYEGKSVPVSAWTSGGSADFPYHADVPCSGVTADDIPDVTFSSSDARSGIFDVVSDTIHNAVRIYASEIPSATVTISTIRVMR